MDSAAAAATDLNQQGSRGPGVNATFSGDAEWEIPRANLNVEKVIGRGAFGVVSRAMAWDLPGRPGWSLVAVKSVQGTLISLTYTTYNGTPLSDTGLICTSRIMNNILGTFTTIPTEFYNGFF